MTDSPLSRRRLLRSGVAAGTLLLAGCGGNGSSGTPTGTESETDTPGTTDTASPTDEPTPTRRPTAAIGEVVGDDSLSMVMLGARQRQSVAGQAASDGNVMLVTFFEVKNRTTDTFLPMGDFEAFELVTESNTYSRLRVPDEPGNLFRSDLVAPGEVLQGYVAFEVPTDVAARAVELDIDSSHTDIEYATFTFQRGSGDITQLEQDLHVPVLAVGESATSGALSVTVEDFRTTDSVGDVQTAEDTTFAIPKLSIENSDDESQLVVLTGQAHLKNQTGQVYATSIQAQPSLDTALDWTAEVPANDSVEGEIPYNAGVDVSPLYFVFDFSGVNGGDRYFWQVA